MLCRYFGTFIIRFRFRFRIRIRIRFMAIRYPLFAIIIIALIED
jgi:hypothetical protein